MLRLPLWFLEVWAFLLPFSGYQKRLCGQAFPCCLSLAAVYIYRCLVAKRRKMQAERVKRVEYTLPQRENAYIRARLQDGLRVESGEETAQMRARLGYARLLLGKVKCAPLSIAERLQAEEMEKILSLYRGKTAWTVEELRGVNDMCAALLKLSAKYAV